MDIEPEQPVRRVPDPPFPTIQRGAPQLDEPIIPSDLLGVTIETGEDPKEGEDIKPEELTAAAKSKLTNNEPTTVMDIEQDEPSAFQAKVRASRHHDDEIELNIEDASAMNTTDVIKLPAFGLPPGVEVPEDIDQLLFTPMIIGLTTEVSDFYTSHVKMLKLKNVLREMAALQQMETTVYNQEPDPAMQNNIYDENTMYAAEPENEVVVEGEQINAFKKEEEKDEHEMDIEYPSLTNGDLANGSIKPETGEETGDAE